VVPKLKIIDPESFEITPELLIEVPSFEKPKVSILIPQYNQENYTLACIRSIVEHTEDVSYEIIVMDDKSPNPGAGEIERNLKNVKFIVNGINYGFLQNCNKGAKFAEGEYILFLNNDTNVQPGWLSSLVELIESADDIGMVGSRLVYPDGRQQEAGGIVWRDASAWNFGRLDDPSKPDYNYVRETDYISGAAIMIKSSLWREIGGFDERYVPAYFEDTDLAFEVRRHGQRVMYQPKSIVIHFEGISHGTDTDSGMKRYQLINREKFLSKWKETLQREHFENGQNVFLARDRSAKRKKVLFVDHYLPHFDQDAGSKAAYQYLKILLKGGYKVYFVGDNFWHYPQTPYLEALTQLGIEVLYGNWYAKNWQRWFEENGKYFDYAILSRPHIANKYIDTVKRFSDAKIVYMGHDLHFLREYREYMVKKEEKYLQSSLEWKEREMALIEEADVSYFFSSVEKEEILKIDNTANIDVVPLYIYEEFSNIEYSPKNRKDIMFVGGFAHTPNVDAVLWFVENVWPKIKKKIGNLKFYIIGSKPTEDILALSSEDIVVTGYVDDETLDRYYRECRLVVAPLRYGAGIKGKIVDALYKSMPVVTTSIGAEGLDGADSCMMIADNESEFAKKTIALYKDRKMAEKISKNAIEYCKKNFSQKSAIEKLSSLFREFDDCDISG
jgi:GT2 family glycosyltransferase